MVAFGLATFVQDGRPAPALVIDDRVVPLSGWGSVDDILADWDSALPRCEAAAASADLATAPLLESVDVVAPYRPRQIFCAGANYRKHVIGLIMGDPSMRREEQDGLSDDERRAQAEARMDARAKDGAPYMFIKLPSCVIGPRDTVILPNNVAKPDWELELGVVIGKRARHVTPATAMEHVAGYVVVNDVTARDHVFRRDQPALGADWLSGKCFPTFLPFGPMIVPRQFVADPYALTITLSVNGKVYQDESTADMMVNIERQIAYLSDRVELMPGDVICTGSPYGNGSAFGIALKDGDVMEGTITGLGTQRNLCTAEA